MRLGLKSWIYAGGTVCVLVLPRLAFAVTMGSLAPHDPPANGQANEQWVADPHNKCIAADPNYRPDDSISWQGQCRRDGVIYGAGTLTFYNAGQAVETISGTFNDGLLQRGHVTATWWSDGTKYDGSQLAGLFNGTGKFVSPKGNTFDGEWKMGVFQTGKASVVWANGDRYDGEWKNGKADGQGAEVWADGRRYEGQWRDGAPLGGDVPANANDSASAATGPAALAVSAGAAAQQPTQGASLLQPVSAKPAGSVALGVPTAAVAAAMIRTGAAPANGNATPNSALPLRSMLGSELAAIDGATLELGLTGNGFERTLVLPNGNSQEIEFAFANGPLGTVFDGGTEIGVFRAKPDEVDIDYADGTTETIGNGSGGLIDRAQGADGHTMCTAWYPQGHVFSQSEKQAALQVYATRLGLPVSAPTKKQHAQTANPACGGAFIASGNQQKAASAPMQDSGAARALAAPPVPAQRAQAAAGAPQQRSAALDTGAVTVPTSAVHLIDDPSAPARFESASFAPGQPLQATNGAGAAAIAPTPQPGASDCLTVASNGEYWGFQNHCTKSVQFSYCEMSDANPLTSCNHTSVAGSVAANGFSALVSDHSIAEKDATHEFRWMACDGGAGEVVPHLDKIDPPSGRCERAVASTP